jgi:hypothetical protein
MIKFMKTFADAHIFRMTDDTGMFQHAIFSVPNRWMGYTTDDNARALIMAVMLYEQKQKPEYLTLIYRYLGFVLHAQNENGRFRNFMDYDRKFTETEGSEDCFGRCLWALGYTQASPDMPSGIKEACIGAFQRAMPNIQDLIWARGQAYALIGLGFIDDPEVDSLISECADSLADRFEQGSVEADWQWFENSITYDNAALPWALFTAYSRVGRERLLRVAQESLGFLDRCTFRDGYFHPVGCKGWFMCGAEPARYDEQPIEASTSVLAHLAAYEATGDTAMLALARKSFAWYLGENSHHESLIDPETEGCRDGLVLGGMNQNQGAESIVGYAIADLALMQYATVATGMSGRGEKLAVHPAGAQEQDVTWKKPAATAAD